MRVVAGLAGGLTLEVPKGVDLRPTMDLVRGAIFSSLGERVIGARVLDLFAGTGALGIEALSRGAASAVLVEEDRRAAASITRNLAKTRFTVSCKSMNFPLPGSGGQAGRVRPDFRRSALCETARGAGFCAGAVWARRPAHRARAGGHLYPGTPARGDPAAGAAIGRVSVKSVTAPPPSRSWPRSILLSHSSDRCRSS